MPKNFQFYGGAPADHGALAGLFASSISAATQAGMMKSEAMQRAGETLLRGVNRAVDRAEAKKATAAQRKHDKQQRDEYFDFQRQMAEDARGATAERDLRQVEESRRAAKLQAAQRLGEVGIREQGLPAGPVTRSILDMHGEGAGGAVGVPPVGIPGVAPGSQQAPPPGMLQGGTSQTDRIQAQGAAFGQQDPNDPFAGIQPLPQRPAWDERRFNFTQEEKDRTAQAAQHIATLKAHKDKDLFLEVKRTRADALGLGDYDEFELQEAVLEAYPELAKKNAEGELVNQKALDAKLRFLQKERTELVPWGPGLAGKDWDFVDKDPSIISAALTEVLGDRYYERVPYTDEAVNAWADKAILDRNPEYVNRFRPTQSQRIEQAPQFQEEALGPMKPALWTTQFIKDFGGTPEQMPLELRSANTFGMRIVPDGEGNILLVRPDGTPMEPAYQGALQELLDGPLGANLRNKLSVGAEVNTTLSELRKLSPPKEGSTNRPASQSQGSAGASPVDRGGGAGQATPKRDRSALDKLEAMWDAEGKGPPPGAGNFSAIGRMPSGEDALSLLLQSGGR